MASQKLLLLSASWETPKQQSARFSPIIDYPSRLFYLLLRISSQQELLDLTLDRARIVN